MGGLKKIARPKDGAEEKRMQKHDKKPFFSAYDTLQSVT